MNPNETKKMHELAEHLLTLFRTNSAESILGNHRIPDTFSELHILMDGCDQICRKYGESVTTAEGMRKLAPEITDPSLLATAIYSKWRWYARWAADPNDVLSPEAAGWFTAALTRLSELTA